MCACPMYTPHVHLPAYVQCLAMNQTLVDQDLHTAQTHQGLMYTPLSTTWHLEGLLWIGGGLWHHGNLEHLTHVHLWACFVVPWFSAAITDLPEDCPNFLGIALACVAQGCQYFYAWHPNQHRD